MRVTYLIGETELLDPFKLFGRLLILFLRLAAYLAILVFQVIWFSAHGRREIGEAIAHFSRSVVDAVNDVFRD